ncbi:outer membrane protein OmpA-like peptidoglycan-associated protein [Pedobacter sp. AK013]|uniref:OmpA family protein n=1 Tax=Pedobacter sp. AK013 TaxID=2723071 RepID=UPI001607D4F0|nr:OmpA family protein [Pedobacter sp. AK013]MBB6237056.1 outer membrane protein OmpA-like peptidoglycan-associated protein [Pedobacter sp. AK013]
MRYKKLSLILFSMLCSFSATAQYVLNEADRAFEQYNYDKAIDLYEQAYKKKATLHAAERLAACYNYQRNYKQTESWYAIAAGMEKSPAENTLAYAKALQSNSKYSEAKIQYNNYADLNKNLNPSLKSMWLRSCDSAMYWMKEPKSVVINNEKSLNSPQSDWGAVMQKGMIVFSSDRGLKGKDEQSGNKPFLKFDGSKAPNKTIYGWTGNHYLKLYTKTGADSIALFPIGTGTDYHVGPASFTQNGGEMYFTLTRIPAQLDYTKVKILKGKQATVNIEIYSSKKDASGKWGTPVAFKYNNVNQYSVGDPFISTDEQSLYFSSNRPGGKGGTDLYVCQKTAEGDWGLPINLTEINTEGNERNPSFDGDNNFYFSSDGRVGMGGLDIFSAKLIGGKISEPQNMGYPVNSPQDDFTFNLSTATTGFLSSNRIDGSGEDDIYSFTQQLILAFKLTGTVYNKTTGQPLGNTIVTLNKTGGSTLKVETDENGRFRFNLERASDYGLKGEKTNYRSDGDSLTTIGLTASTEIKKHLYLEAIEINKAIKLENIYYDFDKSNIRADATIELDKLVKIMTDNPTIWIELGSHTDSRGNDAYNLALSQRRADAAVQYIIDRGISKNRITAVGYGETRLLNKCTNGVQCTAAEHQLNRRTEFKIVKQ